MTTSFDEAAHPREPGGQFAVKAAPEASGGLGALTGAGQGPADEAGQVRELTAYDLSRLADCGAPLNSDSAGAKYLTLVRDQLLDDYAQEEDKDDFLSDDGDLAYQYADGAVPVYTTDIEQTFIDLELWDEDLSDLGDAGSTDVRDLAAIGLVLQGERLGSALTQRLREAQGNGQFDKELAAIRQEKPWKLGEDSGIASPSGEAGNTSGAFVSSLRDQFVERASGLSPDDREAWLDGEADDEVREYADSEVSSMSTYNQWRLAAATDATGEDLSEIGIDADVNAIMTQAIYRAGEREACALLEELRQARARRAGDTG